jgi:hypothetical protein
MYGAPVGVVPKHETFTSIPAFVIGKEFVPQAVSLGQLKALVRRARKGG